MARNTREREFKDQKERERQEAAAKRKSRVDRRRGEGRIIPGTSWTHPLTSRSLESDPLEDASTLPPASAISTPPNLELQASRTNPKKPMRPAPKNVRRVGRNQYTKDRDPPTSVAQPSSLSQSLNPNPEPAMRTRSRSRSNARDMGSPDKLNGSTHLGNGLKPGDEAGSSRPSKPKRLNPNRTSMNEMRRRVAAISDFVQRAEGEERRRSGGGGGNSTSDGASPDGSKVSDGSEPGRAERTNPDHAIVAGEGVPPAVNGGDGFASMDALSMMTSIKARLDDWERQFGRPVRT